MIWNVKSKCNRMTLKLWWHKFNYMSKHTHMLLWETEQNMHLDVDFMLPDFIHAPQMDFLWTGQSGGPPTVWDQGLKYLLAVYKEKKKNSTAISHRVRRQEGWTDQTGDEQRSTCNPATSPPVNEPEESGLWRNCLPEAMNHTEHKSHVQWIAQGSIKVHTEVWVFFVLYSIWLSVTSLSIACFVHFQV